MNDDYLDNMDDVIAWLEESWVNEGDAELRFFMQGQLSGLRRARQLYIDLKSR